MATQKEVAEHIDLSDRQVRTLVRNAVIPAGKGSGGYDIDSCRIAYIRYQRSLGAGKVRAEPDRPAEQIDYELERARLTKEQADWQELKNAQARREVAPIKLIEWTLNRVGAQLGPLLESIPQKVKRRVPALNATQIEIIKKEVIKAQNLMARITVDLDEYRDPAGDSDIDTPGPAGI